MAGTQKIDWQEYVEGHNRMHGTTFKTPQEMIAALYEREGTLQKVEKILGIAGQTIGAYMKKWGLPRLPKGHRGNSAFQIAFRKIKNPGQYKHRELAEMLGCSIGYVHNLAKRHTK